MDRIPRILRRFACDVRFYGVIVPMEMLFRLCGVSQDSLDVRRLRGQDWLWAAWLLVSSLVLLPWRLFVRTFYFVLGTIRELLFALGLVQDDLDASHAMRRSVLLRAVTVVVSLAAMIGLGVWLSISHAAQDTVAWETTARAALENHDYRRASIAYQRLVQVHPENRWIYGWAVAQEHLGNDDRAAELMASIAPAAAVGYLPAQLWIARKALERPEIRVADADLTRRRLARILETNPDNSEASLLMAKVLLNLGQRAAAEPYLATGASSHPELSLLSAELDASLGDRDEQHRDAVAARDYYQKRLSLTPADVGARIGLAKAELLLGAYEKSVETLREGMTDRNDPSLEQTWSEALTAWSLSLSARSDDAPRRYEMLSEALSRDPRNGSAVVQLIELRSGSADLRAKVDRTLESLDFEKLPALAHVALGNAAWADNRHAAARRHYEQAYRQEPDHPGVANNFAWSLSHSEPRQLERAKVLCDDALRLAPFQQNLLDTRADILIQLGQWRAAHVDLDALARLYPGQPGVKEKLDAVARHLDTSATK
ncbi:MAG TPA: tetratricopeptide repeat protein [Pirellulales bacterium]|nr:tetratricopeptide repeat protein [Pirellulales bacterium]